MKSPVLTLIDLDKATKLLLICFSIFHIAYAGGIVSISTFSYRAIHLGFAMLLGFLINRPKQMRWWNVAIDVFFCIATILITYYLSKQWLDATYRIGRPSFLDSLVAIFLIICVLEFGRRTMGSTLSIVAIIFFLYTFTGPYLPGFLAHRGQTFERVIGSLMLSSDGIFGMPIAASANYIILFVIFSALLQSFGAGDFFLEAASALIGWARGGPAKIAVIASAAFGTINGSALGNVVGTGSFTIPLMKKSGYPATFAGAVEAVASTGGQLMPPVMGTAAFIIAEFLGISYFDVVKAAALPAILYFTSLFFMVDLEAAKLNLRGLKREELPKLKPVLRKGWPYLFPIITLVFLLMIMRSSIMKAGFWAIMVTFPCAWIVTRRKKPFFLTLWDALSLGTKWALPTAAACAVGGMIIGTIGLTGLAYKFSGVVVSLAGNNLFFLLILTAISSLILGMGLPTTPAYIFVSLISVPPLIKFGIPALGAHLFAFYFAILSSVTPPVALSAFAAAGIAEASPYKTGWIASKIGISAFLVPFAFVYGNELLMMGETLDILTTVVFSLIGCFLLASSVSGWLFYQCTIVERIISLVAAVLLIHVGIFTSLMGLFLFSLILISNKKGLGKFQLKKHENI